MSKQNSIRMLFGLTIAMCASACSSALDNQTQNSSAMITDDTVAYKAIYQSDTPVLIEFCASWAENSTKMAPLVEEAVAEYKGGIKFIKLDIEKTPQTTQLFEVNTVPTLCLVSKRCKHGKQLVGLRNKDEISMFIRSSYAECQ